MPWEILSMGIFDKLFKNDDKFEQLFKNSVNYEDPDKKFSVQIPAIYGSNEPIEDEALKILGSPGEKEITFVGGYGTFSIYICQNNSKNIDEWYEDYKKTNIEIFNPKMEKVLLSNHPAIKISYQLDEMPPHFTKFYEYLFWVKKGENLFNLKFHFQENKYLKRYLDSIPMICKSFKITI